MKFIAVFALALALTQAVQVTSGVKSSADLALEGKIDTLKQSGWGRVAVGLVEL